MRWLEIIDVEAAKPKDRRRIIELCSKIRVPQSAALILYEDSLRNELSIHIQWRFQSAMQGGRSQLARDMSSSVSDYGLVTHTLWVEGNQSDSGEQLDCPVPKEGKS